MELFIAILWYLQVLVSGASYSPQEIDTMIMENQAAIEAIQADQQKMDQVFDGYREETLNTDKGLIEVWEEEPEPILN